MTPSILFQQIAALSAEFADIVNEHLADNDELLPHLLMGDLLRYVGAKIETGQPRQMEEVKAILDVIDVALGSGDERTENAIAASFLEHVEVEPFYPTLRSLFGPRLMSEHERQLSWRPNCR